jgi:hypothetical protein
MAQKIAITAREFVRHALYRLGAYGALIRFRAFRGYEVSHLDAPTRAARFKAIYDTGVWKVGKEEIPDSGEGSSLEATSVLRTELPRLLDDLQVHALLDIGCGDFNWMQHVNLRQQYVGVDIVESVIARNRKLFSGPNRSFLVLDAVRDTLPDAEAVLCREVLFHLSLGDAKAMLRNMLGTPRSYFILTSDRVTRFNSDIPTGDFRVLNLEAWPFNFPPPLREISEIAGAPGRIVGIWRTDQIASVI